MLGTIVTENHFILQTIDDSLHMDPESLCTAVLVRKRELMF